MSYKNEYDKFIDLVKDEKKLNSLSTEILEISLEVLDDKEFKDIILQKMNNRELLKKELYKYFICNLPIDELGRINYPSLSRVSDKEEYLVLLGERLYNHMGKNMINIEEVYKILDEQREISKEKFIYLGVLSYARTFKDAETILNYIKENYLNKKTSKEIYHYILENNHLADSEKLSLIKMISDIFEKRVSEEVIIELKKIYQSSYKELKRIAKKFDDKEILNLFNREVI